MAKPEELKLKRCCQVKSIITVHSVLYLLWVCTNRSCICNFGLTRVSLP